MYTFYFLIYFNIRLKNRVTRPQFVKKLLAIKDLSVSVEDKNILNGISFSVEPGQTVALMGPNGSGKSTLAYSIMGHPRYKITSGSIEFDGTAINTLSPDKRAKLGIFLSMQQPVEIEGIPLKDFLRQAYNTLYDGTPKQLRLKEFNDYFNQQLKLLGITLDFAQRSINVGFSGGEKKMAEMLQLAVLQPKLVILDEVDSGLDVDALKKIGTALNTIKSQNPNLTLLIITHYKRILEYLVPDTVHIIQQGKIIRSGDRNLADDVDKKGY